jgi:hypothetical protein
MTSNLKLILSAVGVAALLASPAMAKSRHDVARSLANVPSDARAESIAPAPSFAPPASTQRVYAPDQPVPQHYRDLNPDFQLGGER